MRLGLALVAGCVAAGCGAPKPPHRWSPAGAGFEMWTYSGRGASEGPSTERAFGNGKQWQMFGDDDQLGYKVSQYRAPHAPASRDDLERRSEQWATQSVGKIAKREEIERDGRPGRAFEIQHETGSTTFARVYLDGTDYYLIEVWSSSWEPPKLEREHIERFLGSFRFLGEPAPAL